MKNDISGDDPGIMIKAMDKITDKIIIPIGRKTIQPIGRKIIQSERAMNFLKDLGRVILTLILLYLIGREIAHTFEPPPKGMPAADIWH